METYIARFSESCSLQDQPFYKKGLLHKLPLELLSKVFAYLSIKDCKLLEHLLDPKIAKFNLVNRELSKQVKAVCADRMNATIYLSQYFKNPSILLDTMATNDAIISGSRALDYFEGQSTDKNSDWDFYILNDIAKVCTFMRDCEKCGIRWLSTAEYIENKITQSSETCIISDFDLIFIVENIDAYKENTFITDIFNQIIQQYIDEFGDAVGYNIYGIPRMHRHCKTYNIIRKNKSLCKLRTVSEEYSTENNISIVNGLLTHNGAVTKIQLIVADTNHPLDVLMDFHITPVQCALTGYAAVHLYATDAFNKVYRIWNTKYDSDIIGRQQSLEHIAKYKARGYTQHIAVDSKQPLSRPNNRRILGDDVSLIVLSEYRTRPILSTVSDIKTHSLLNFSWYEGKSMLKQDDGMIRDLIVKRQFITKAFGTTLNSPVTEYIDKVFRRYSIFKCETNSIEIENLQSYISIAAISHNLERWVNSN